MSKKLVALISTTGKTSEEIHKELKIALADFRAKALGLTKCQQCGEYKGDCIDDGEKLTVLCICDGVSCSKCKKNVIRRPISNYFDMSDGQIWHVPYLKHRCGRC